MKTTRTLVVATIATMCGLSMLLGFAAANDEAAAAMPKLGESPLRQLVRGRSSFIANADEDDAGRFADVDEEEPDRELGRIKRRRGDDDDISSKGSKGSSSKGSKGGSKGGDDDDDGGSGGFRGCAPGCGDKDFAYIHLGGDYFFGSPTDNSTSVVPIEGTGILNDTKPGSTIRILEDDLHGTVEYFDHYDDHPYKYDISGVITGSCTILDFFPIKDSDGFTIGKTCIAHCTICVTYKGECCDKPDYAYDGWRDLSAWEPIYNCTHFGGFATVTGDLFFDLEQDSTGALIGFQDGGLTGLRGMGAVTGTAGDLGPSANGGLAFVDYDTSISDEFKIGLKIPFSDSASCKLQDYAAEYFNY